MKYPLVYVKKALRAVPDFHLGLPGCVETAYDHSIAKHGLTRDEAAAIRIYTAQCDVYRQLNAALRSQQLTNIKPWFQYLKLFQTAIEKLSPPSQLFCRGEPVDSSDGLAVGSTVTWVSRVKKTMSFCNVFSGP
jgi:hypothetical protein